MPLQTFTHTPSRGMKRNTKPRVTSITFGDGYVQRTQRGLNALDESFSLSFVNIPNTDAQSIVTFFEDHKGYLPFKWTPTGDSVELLMVCSEWDVLVENTISKTINATFTRTYDPSV